jgi:hypothetical protein
MKMKILAVPLVLLAVGCRDRYEGQAGAASSPSPTASPYTEGTGAYASPGTTASGAGVAAVVVSVDPTGRTITLREVVAPGGAPIGDSAGKRYNVSSTAAPSLSDVKAGEQVFVVCDTAPGATGSTGTTTSGAGSLANCTMITMITEAGVATTGR